MKLDEIKSRKGYSGWKLSEADRTQLAEHFIPKYEKFVGHHVTYKFGVNESDPLPPGGKYEIVGHADSGDGLEALVIAIDDDPNRNDGSLYHITWSLNDNYKPKDSNALVQKGYERISPISINLEPTFFPF